MKLDQFSAAYLPLVDASLAARLSPDGGAASAFYGMMHYHLGWADAALRPVRSHPGKRLRPLLCLLACRAAGGDPVQALPAACALELVHSFSLVHDDIEDGSPMRRGRPAVWHVWGTAQAINVGDGLFALARLAVLGLREAGVPPDRVLEAAQALDSACLALCEGQFLDMSFQGRSDVGLEQYLAMIRLKTGALLAASAELGAIVAGGDVECIAALRRFGENLGLAFQIQDDVLGTWGEEEVTGKPASTDLRDKKKTLPVVHALTDDRQPADARRLSALFGPGGALSAQECSEALAILGRSGSREYAERTAAGCFRTAMESLEPVGLPGQGRDVLAEFAESLLGRRA